MVFRRRATSSLTISLTLRLIFDKPLDFVKPRVSLKSCYAL
ncbi:MAG: hypothetical protein ACUVUG_06740 [Candidatus Aminicenantia bacterium]